MSVQSLLRWGVFAIILTAILFAANGLLVMVMPSGGLASPLAPTVSFLGLVVAVPAYTALYLVQFKNAGRLGFAGFVLSIIGQILYATPLFALIAGTSGVQEWHAIWAFAMGNVLLFGPGAFFIGSILLGIAGQRAGVLPRWSGSLITAGSFIWLVAYYTSLPVLLTVAGLILGAGLGWSGAALWKGADQKVLAAQPQSAV